MILSVYKYQFVVKNATKVQFEKFIVTEKLDKDKIFAMGTDKAKPILLDLDNINLDKSSPEIKKSLEKSKFTSKPKSQKLSMYFYFPYYITFFSIVIFKIIHGDHE